MVFGGLAIVGGLEKRFQRKVPPRINFGGGECEELCVLCALASLEIEIDIEPARLGELLNISSEV
jgi:hypothetical protein